MLYRFLLFLALATNCLAVNWNAPSSVPSGQSYYVEAQADSWMSDPSMSMSKNGWYFASGSTSAGGWTSDSGAQTVTFEVWGQDAATSYYFSGSWDVNIIGSNYPSGSLSVPSSVYTGESFTVYAYAYDVDGDLADMGLRWQGNGLQETWSVQGSADSKSTTLTAPSSPGTIYLRVEVWDQAGHGVAEGWEPIEVIEPNHTPDAWISGSTSLTYGQSSTLNFGADDEDGNLYRWRFYASTNPSPQWSYVSGSSVSSSHSPSYASAGTYTWIVEVEDGDGASDTATLVVTVSKANQGAVSISPSSQTVTVGDSITFTASGGNGGGAYTWGGDASGTGTSKSVTFNTVGTRTVTVYRAGDNNYNTSNTATATITVKANQSAVSISPSSQTVTVGGSINFSASGGDGTGAYTWGGDASGTGSSKSVTFNSVGTRTVTVYRAGDSNYNASNTATATITVNSGVFAPSISSHPQSQTVTAGSNVTFSVVATGNPSPDYEWRKGGSAIPGAPNSASYTITNVQPGHVGSYTVYVSNSQGNTTSLAATLTVNTAPTITVQPQSQTVATGATVSFTVVANGSPAPGYQWKKNGANIAGAQSSTLTLTNVTSAGDAATYSVVVSNVAGTVTSSNATLTVNASQSDTTNQNQLNVHTP